MVDFHMLPTCVHCGVCYVRTIATALEGIRIRFGGIFSSSFAQSFVVVQTWSEQLDVVWSALDCKSILSWNNRWPKGRKQSDSCLLAITTLFICALEEGVDKKDTKCADGILNMHPERNVGQLFAKTQSPPWDKALGHLQWHEKGARSIKWKQSTWVVIKEKKARFVWPQIRYIWCKKQDFRSMQALKFL